MQGAPGLLCRVLRAGRWLVVPFAPVEQPQFFVCSPESLSAFSATRGLEIARFELNRQPEVPARLRMGPQVTPARSASN